MSIADGFQCNKITVIHLSCSIHDSEFEFGNGLSVYRLTLMVAIAKNNNLNHLPAQPR